MSIKLVISPSQQDGTEQPLIQPIAQRLYDILDADNILDVYLCPYFPGNDESALYQAIQWSNGINPDYHFALHADAGGYARGASGLYFSENGRKFITPITQAIMDITPWSDVGVKYRDNLGELKRTNAVAGLLEISFYDNSEELSWMKANTELIVQTIKSGIYKALNIVKPTPVDNFLLTALLKDLKGLVGKYEGAK